MDLCLTISDLNWQLIKDIVSIIEALGILLIGYVGLSTWKKQLKGTNEYELAKKAIICTYQVQQLIQSVRNPLLVYNKEDNTEKQNKLEEEKSIYEKRMNALDEKWSELMLIRLEAKAIWEENAYSCFEGLKKVKIELSGAIWEHFWMKGAFAMLGATVDSNPKRVEANNKVIYLTSDNSDDFSVEITNAVNNIERFFAPKVHGK